jgi:hypothetical protein
MLFPNLVVCYSWFVFCGLREQPVESSSESINSTMLFVVFSVRIRAYEANYCDVRHVYIRHYVSVIEPL